MSRDRTIADIMSRRPGRTMASHAELVPFLGQRWAIRRNTAENRARYGRCITLREYAEAHADAIAARGQTSRPGGILSKPVGFGEICRRIYLRGSPEAGYRVVNLLGLTGHETPVATATEGHRIVAQLRDEARAKGVTELSFAHIAPFSVLYQQAKA